MASSDHPLCVKRALISVSDKSGIVDFARFLTEQGVEILSTGGTYQLLNDHGITATEIAEYTGFPEIMGGRVKTLHPKVHGGILGRRGLDDEVMATHNIAAIDLVVVNLYPFQRTIANPACDLATAIENIDIGGPTMVRAAAKNHRDVVTVVHPQDYTSVSRMLAEDGAISASTRFSLALKAFEHTATYDSAIANYLAQQVGDQEAEIFGPTMNLQFHKRQNLRYGENPHQAAAFYADDRPTLASVASASQLQGKALSFNNIADTDAALETVKQFDLPTCVIVKHANPCGIACADTLVNAYQKAFATDPESAFGGIIAVNKTLDGATANAIIEGQFVEVIIAPAVSQDAIACIRQKPNVRLLECGLWDGLEQQPLDFKRVAGGLLVQHCDVGMVSKEDLRVVSKRSPNASELDDLMFAWKAAKMVKSNAIVYAKDLQTVGVGAGQMSRINSARIAAIKAEHAGLSVPGSVMASDAFFPFRDGIDNAAAAGVRAVIQPGGSMRDAEVIAAADEHDIAMVFTGMRHFRH